MQTRKTAALLAAAVAMVAGTGAAGASSGDAETLTFWTLQQSDSNIVEAQDAAVAEFEEAHNVDVEMTAFPYLELRDKLLLAASSDAAPDVLMLDQIWVAQYAGAGYVDPIDDRMEGANINAEDYFVGAWDSGFYDGAQYTVPFDVGVWAVMYYNKSLFEEAGLDPEAPPATWDELLTALQTLEDNTDVDPLATWVGAGDAPNCLYDAFVFSNGGQVLDTETNQAALNSPEAVEALDFYNSLMAFGADGAVGRTEEDGMTLFTSEQAAINFYGEWGQETIATQNPELDYGVGLLPAPEGKESIGCFGGFNLGISANSSNKDLAWEFIQYASGFEKQQEITMLTPANSEAAALYLDARRQYPDVIAQQLEQASFRPLIPNYPEFADIQRSALESVFLGEATSQEALDAAVEEMNEILQ